MRWLLSCLTGTAIVFIASACQPPAASFYTPSYSQVAPSYSAPNYYSPTGQAYQPAPDSPTGYGYGATVGRNPVLPEKIPLPSQSSSFLQDNSLEEETANAFASIGNNSVLAPIDSRPPPDPPANPFEPEADSEVQNPETTVAVVEECSKRGIADFRQFVQCTDSVPYGITSLHAQFGSDRCDFEPEFVCRFYSSKEDVVPFKSGIFRVSPQANRIVEETFATFTKRPEGELPDKSFIFAEARRTLDPQAAGVLKTDVTCQKGDGKLRFDYWLTDPAINLRVCTSNERERSCTQEITYDAEAAGVLVDVIHPGGTKFTVEIVASNFVRPGAFILDNLVYEADTCEDAAFMPATTRPPPVQAPGNVHNFAFGSQLHPQSFPIVSDRVRIQPLPRPDEPVLQPLPDAGYVTAPPTRPPTNYVTKPAILNFRPPMPPNIHVRRVTSTSVPPSGERYAASSKPEISDGVRFVQNRYSQAPKPKSQERPLSIHKITDACNVLQCSFDNDFCNFTQPVINSDGARYGKWQVSRSPIGNPLTGIKAQEHGGFAFVGMDQHSAKVKGRTVYVLESPSFTLPADTLLNFDLYCRSNAITLQVCVDSLLNCPYEAPALTSTVYWREGESLLLPQATRKIFFVATQWKRFKWLAIDNVVLNKGRGCVGVAAVRN